jgi:hypothetical protein
MKEVKAVGDGEDLLAFFKGADANCALHILHAGF